MERYELVYKIDKNKSHIRILGEDFYKRNKISGFYIFKNIGYKLREKLEIKNIEESEIKIEIRFFMEIFNKSYMFKDCESLIKFSIPTEKIKEQKSPSIEKYEDDVENLIDLYMEDNTANDNLFKNLENFDTLSGFSTIEKSYKYSEKSTIENVINKLKVIPDEVLNLTGMFALH